jgi:adenosine kinase
MKGGGFEPAKRYGERRPESYNAREPRKILRGTTPITTSFKIAVLGPIPRDHITTHHHRVIEKYGCVVYTVAALSALVDDGSRILPVSHLRHVDYEPVRRLLAPLPHVDLRHITADADQGDVVMLKYVDQNRRIGRQTAFMNPIVPEDVEELLDCDAFVFVPVTDFEVSLTTLEYIKANSDGVIIFDAHGPTNSCTRRGERYLQFWVDRDAWLPYIDILKMNLEEAGCSWFASEYEPEELLQGEIELPLDELPDLAAHCLRHGIKALYVTLNASGCMLYHEDDAGRVQERLVKSIPVSHVIDTTGCGDSFAGGLAFGYLKTRNYLKACYYANAMGAQRCAGAELAIYKSLAETERKIAHTYGSSEG